jgi:ABC-type sugar transport system permease subunit/ABC-type glycerol-3-phosphate transport system substrate-binding protein
MPRSRGANSWYIPAPVVSRHAGTLLFVALLVVSAPAAFANEVPPAKVSIRVERLPEDKDQRITAVAVRAVIRQFVKENPDVDIQPFTMPIVTGGTAADSGPLMAIAAGVPPHVMFLNFRRSSTYISQGFLEPLEPLLARVLSTNPRVREADANGKWLEDPSPDEIAKALDIIRSRVAKPVWPVVYHADDSGRIPGEHAWTIPTTNLIVALLYRRDMFYEAGLDPDRPPRDWDEFLDYARRLTRPERGQYGFGLFGMSLAWSTNPFLASNGARVLERDGATGAWRAVYGTPEAAEAVRYLWRLIHEPFERDGRTLRGAAQVFPYRAEEAWDRGTLAMITTYVNEEVMHNIKPQLVGIAPVPLSPKGTRNSEINGEMLGVFSGSSPAEKLAAMRYIFYRTGDDAQHIRTKAYVDAGYGIFVNPDLLKRFGYEQILPQVPREWKVAFDEAMSHGIPEPYGMNTGPIWRYMATPINSALELPLDRMSKDQAQAAVLRLMKDSADEVNRKLLGVVPEDEMRLRRNVALAVVSVVALAFIVGMAHVWRYFGRMARAAAGGGRRVAATGYVLILPALLLIILWQYVPLLGGAGIAVAEYELARPSRWVGLDNFAAVLFDERFWRAFARTFYFVALVIGLGFWPPILLAILLQEIPTTTAKYAFRIIYYLPALVSGVFVMFLWRGFYDPTANGILNQVVMAVNHFGPVPATLLKLTLAGFWLALIIVLVRLPLRVTEMSAAMKAILWLAAAVFVAATTYALANLGTGALFGRFDVKPLRWIFSPELAMVCVVIPMVWAASGASSILYLAALKTVPEEIYEAADIDGANHWHKVFYIVLPRLKYLITIQFIAAVIGAFKGGTDYILALTGGGPNDATTVLALEIYIRAFLDLRFGIGASMAWILGALLVGFTAYQLKMLSRAEFKAGG